MASEDFSGREKMRQVRMQMERPRGVGVNETLPSGQHSPLPPVPRALSAQAASPAASLTPASLSGAYEPTSERPSSSRSTRRFLSKTLLALKLFWGIHRPSRAQVSGQNPSSWQARVCCEGPPDFVGASECLIANWLN